MLFRKDIPKPKKRKTVQIPRNDKFKTDIKPKNKNLIKPINNNNIVFNKRLFQSELIHLTEFETDSEYIYSINSRKIQYKKCKKMNDVSELNKEQLSEINALIEKENSKEIQKPIKSTEENNNSNYINIMSNKNINELKDNSILDKNGNKNVKYLNKSVNDSITNLNPIKVNNEIYINDGLNPSTFNKKLHAVDQKLLNLELYTKEKILDLIAQINLIKHTCHLPTNDYLSKEKISLDTNKISYLSNKPISNPKYKTCNNSFTNIANLNNQHFNEKNKENISLNNNDNNNINNKNLYIQSNNINPQYIYNNTIDKKRCSLKEVNPKYSFISQKMAQKNNIINANMNNNIYLNNIKQNNSLIDKRNSNYKDIVDGNNNKKAFQNISNDINYKNMKDIEKKNEFGNYYKNSNNEELYNKNSNKNLNIDSDKKNFAYSNSTFNGTEIKLVDLNKLVNHQLPRNRLIPIKINDSDYFVSLNSK